MKFHMDDLKYQALTLPEEVRMYHYAGDFSGELDCIGRWLKRDLPFALRKRLEENTAQKPESKQGEVQPKC